MKKMILFSAFAFILFLSIIFFTGASFLNSKSTVITDKSNKVCITTSLGDIKIRLYDETYKHRDNFIKLVKQSYFDGTLFHRVIQNFMIQGGDPDSKTADSTAILGNGGPGYTIPAEILFDTVSTNTTAGIVKVLHLKYIHKKGALAAARTDNPAKESSGSQFYIVQGNVCTESELNMAETNYIAARRNRHISDYLLKPENVILKNELIKSQTEKNKIKYDSIIKIAASVVNVQYKSEPKFEYTSEQRKIYTTIGGSPHLDCDYTVFGEVYEGNDVVDKIAVVQTSGYPHNRPKKDVKMTVKIIE